MYLETRTPCLRDTSMIDASMCRPMRAVNAHAIWPYVCRRPCVP